MFEYNFDPRIMKIFIILSYRRININALNLKLFIFFF